MRLSDKFNLVKAIQAEGKPLFKSEKLSPKNVTLKDLDTISHKAAQKSLPYLFEQNSAVHALWTLSGSESPYNFIGAHSYVNNGSYLRNHVLIGRYCSIGRRVTIGAGMHAMDGLSTSPALPGKPRVRPDDPYLRLSQKRPTFTIVESDVWIGDGAVILPGVKVGVGSVIGANSVVTRDTTPYGVYAGVPAKLIRRRFSDETCTALLETQWWDVPYDSLRKMPLADVGALMSALTAEIVTEVAYPDNFAVG